MASTTYTCPHCGNPIVLPEGLTEFSCMYCGVRMTLTELTAQAPEPDESREAAAALEAALPDMITGYPQTVKNLSAGAFPAYFNAYIAQHGPVLQLADSLLPEALAPLSAAVIEQVNTWCVHAKKPMGGIDALMDSAKFTLCLLTIPAIRRCAPNGGLALAQALRDAWMAKYPGNSFQLAAYEDIAKGFQKKRLCFITTAVCRYLGRADDCAELTAFRHFRDSWLISQPGGSALIDEYYRIAPAIVTAINFYGDPDTEYPVIWKTWLQPCYEALNRGDPVGCFALYTDMVRRLKMRYLQEAA